MKYFYFLVLFFSFGNFIIASMDTIRPLRSEWIEPIRKKSFDNFSTCKERIQGGDPIIKDGLLMFNGSMDGNRQVDPQIAVGGGFVLHGTNSGLIVYNKNGNYIKGVSQKCFNDGIDPKMFFDIHNKRFVFDLWWYYDKPKIRPVNIAISATSNPLQEWYIYPVPARDGEDGGGIGYSRKWIAYSFPGGACNTFVMRSSDMQQAKRTMVYHFQGSLGHPVFTQDAMDDLFFVDIDEVNIAMNRISEDKDRNIYAQEVWRVAHQLKYIDYPPQSPQLSTTQKISSGDRNPKNLVIQNGSLWFSQAVECNGQSAVQWHQIDIKTGRFIQTGLINSDTSNYIQTTIAINKSDDALIGFQEVNQNSFVSARLAYRHHADPPGTLRSIMKLKEGTGAADGEAWGDYSGSIIDGDNLSDLWTIQSVANPKGKGETIIVKLPKKKLKFK